MERSEIAAIGSSYPLPPSLLSLLKDAPLGTLSSLVFDKSTSKDNVRSMKEIVEVAIGLPVSKTFHYRIPERMRESVQVGMRVLVPFKGRKVTGFTLDLLDHPPPGVEEKLKDLEDLLDEAPLVDRSMLHFCRWISDYYLHPLGEVIKTSLPRGCT